MSPLIEFQPVSTANPFQPPETPPQRPRRRASPQALRQSWTVTSRTFVVLAFIVCGTARFYSCLFDTHIELPALLIILSVVTILVCPATFASTLLDSHRQIGS